MNLMNGNILATTPQEARGYLDFEEEQLGQIRPDVAIGAGAFHGAAALVAIRYAVTANDQEPGWMIVVAWLTGIYAAFRGMTIIGSALSARRSPPAEEETV